MKFALIGHPVAGSLSPRLIAAGYGGAHSYDLLDFEHFEDAWKAFTEGYDGINVTAPFKQDAFRKVDALSPEARKTGAVNLVIPCPEGYKGFNTDVNGVADALRETGLRFRRALVVGTGGAARAAAYAARQLGCEVTVAGRSLEKASALGYEAVPLEEAGSLAPDVILYTLPGSAPVPDGLPFKDAVVIEAEYRIPRLTDIPCRLYVSGRRWMLGQAVAGYRIFTGAEPNLEKMLEVL